MDNQPPFNPPTQQDFPPAPSQPASSSSPQPYPQELTWLEDGPVSKYAPTMGNYMPSASSYNKSRRSTRNHEQKRHCEHPGCSKAFETDKGVSPTHKNAPNPKPERQMPTLWSAAFAHGCTPATWTSLRGVFGCSQGRFQMTEIVLALFLIYSQYLLW